MDQTGYGNYGQIITKTVDLSHGIPGEALEDRLFRGSCQRGGKQTAMQTAHASTLGCDEGMRPGSLRNHRGISSRLAMILGVDRNDDAAFPEKTRNVNYFFKIIKLLLPTFC